MPKYKVGDKVRVVEDLGSRDFYYMEGEHEYNVVVPEMREHSGQVVTIMSVDLYGYRIIEDGWNWTDEMFSGLADEDGDQETEIDESKFISLICVTDTETDRGG